MDKNEMNKLVLTDDPTTSRLMMNTPSTSGNSNTVLKQLKFKYPDFEPFYFFYKDSMDGFLEPEDVEHEGWSMEKACYAFVSNPTMNQSEKVFAFSHEKVLRKDFFHLCSTVLWEMYCRTDDYIIQGLSLTMMEIIDTKYNFMDDGKASEVRLGISVEGRKNRAKTLENRFKILTIAYKDIDSSILRFKNTVQLTSSNLMDRVFIYLCSHEFPEVIDSIPVTTELRLLAQDYPSLYYIYELAVSLSQKYSEDSTRSLEHLLMQKMILCLAEFASLSILDHEEILLIYFKLNNSFIFLREKEALISYINSKSEQQQRNLIGILIDSSFWISMKELILKIQLDSMKVEVCLFVADILSTSESRNLRQSATKEGLLKIYENILGDNYEILENALINIRNSMNQKEFNTIDLIKKDGYIFLLRQIKNGQIVDSSEIRIRYVTDSTKVIGSQFLPQCTLRASTLQPFTHVGLFNLCNLYAEKTSSKLFEVSTVFPKVGATDEETIISLQSCIENAEKYMITTEITEEDQKNLEALLFLRQFLLYGIPFSEYVLLARTTFDEESRGIINNKWFQDLCLKDRLDLTLIMFDLRTKVPNQSTGFQDVVRTYNTVYDKLFGDQSDFLRDAFLQVRFKGLEHRTLVTILEEAFLVYLRDFSQHQSIDLSTFPTTDLLLVIEKMKSKITFKPRSIEYFFYNSFAREDLIETCDYFAKDSSSKVYSTIFKKGEINNENIIFAVESCIENAEVYISTKGFFEKSNIDFQDEYVQKFEDLLMLRNYFLGFYSSSYEDVTINHYVRCMHVSSLKK